MATYYVDYVSGVDTNNGTSTSTPWKHSPGDANATNNPASTTLQPGDSVRFKGGVKYRGEITIDASGTSGSRITFDTATGWGTGKAIITGAETLSASWTQCTSASDCWDNPNWAHIYRTPIPSGFTFWKRLFQDGVFLYPAQNPTPSTLVLFEYLSEWHVIPYPENGKSISTTACKDPSVFTQSSSSYWNGSYIMAWIDGNVVETQPITGFNPATDTISYPALSAEPYPGTHDFDGAYTLFNHPAHIVQAGQYAIRPDENRVYLWTSDSSNPNTATLEYASRNLAFNVTGDYITIDNLYITGTYGDQDLWYAGIGVMLTHNIGVTISNCELAYLQSYTSVASIRQSETSSYTTVSNNYIHHLWTNRGITLANGTNITCHNNRLEYLNHTGIWFSGVTNGTIYENTVSNIRSAHGNGISVYTLSNNVIVERNSLTLGGSVLTHETSDNLIFRNNVFNGLGTGTINQWDADPEHRPVGYIYWINNTIVNGAGGWGAMFRPGGSIGTATYILKNNVIAGGGADIPYANRSHNVYTALAGDQDPAYGWYLSTGESYDTDVDAMFANYAGRDFTPKEDSCLIEAGTNTAATYGVTVDILGYPRPGIYDIGAYEYRNNRIAIGIRGD